MKTTIQFFFFLFAPFCFITKSYSQETRSFSWFGELHTGWQATLNDRPLVAQIKTGYESKPFDSSKHYAAYFKNQVPIEVTVGINNKKGFQFQLDASYYSMKVALSNPPDVSGDEEYLFGNADMLSLKASAFLDYASLNGDVSKSRFHFMSGVTTGVIIPLSMQMNDATAKHFGISSFQKNIVWIAGFQFLLNIDINKNLYVPNSAGFVFPISGNMGQMQMQNNSGYTSGEPVKINSFKISTGIGFRF
ncbi:MAG TPA: hypothetical protein VKT28_13805 [Puia sp.]|nr:hypothetical protein [Puia sp.]